MKSTAPLSAHAVPGALLLVRVTPAAARNAVSEVNGVIRISVTVVAEGGKATAAAQALLAKALGLPKSRLDLVRGATSRDKQFRIL